MIFLAAVVEDHGLVFQVVLMLRCAHFRRGVETARSRDGMEGRGALGRPKPFPF